MTKRFYNENSIIHIQITIKKRVKKKKYQIKNLFKINLNRASTIE